MVCYDQTIFVNLESEDAKNLNIEKIIFKVVQIKFLAMHITNQKLSFDMKGSFAKIDNSKKKNIYVFFHCACQLISIKLQLGLIRLKITKYKYS